MIDWGLGWAVVFTGLVVVFVILLILVFICWLLGKVMSSVSNRKKGDSGSAPAVKADLKPSGSVPAPAPRMEVERGIPGDVVAAITAALVCVTGGSKSVAIRGIKRAKGTRGAWNAAGVMENTRPF